MAMLSALCAALAVWLGIRVPPRGRLRPPPKESPKRRAVPWPLVAGLAVAGAVLPFSGAFIALACGSPSAAVLWLVLRRKRRRSAERGAEVIRACGALAAMLRMGYAPQAALRTAARDEPVLEYAQAAAEVGGGIPAALRRTSAQPGYGMLAEIADAWQVAELTGAPLSTALEAVSVRFEAFAKLRQLVDAEVSSARATGKLLAALPLVGVGLGYAMGGDPLGFLTGSVFGQVVLATGTGLASAGLVWVEKVADVPAQ